MNDYVIRISHSIHVVDAQTWDRLLRTQSHPTPFMQHAYLAALQDSNSACPATGWSPHYITLSQGGELAAATVLFVKDHSYGEYVFDWAWARAYQEHGVPYYPKGVVAVPFTPVPGSRLLARDAAARQRLLQSVVALCSQLGLSSLHLLFGADEDLQAAQQAGLMLRQTVQFHWNNAVPGYRDFEEFLTSLTQEKRKKIRQERRKISSAGVQFSHFRGRDISDAHWDFFYQCYERTYLEHGNAPYLQRDFFDCMARDMPDNWLLFIAKRNGNAIASSLIGLEEHPSAGNLSMPRRVAFGRYWGALERVDCLHFEACYYQPLQWCIENGYHRFEGGAQGEHKMARALLPVITSSAHWIAHPGFASAVLHFLEREAQGIDNYVQELEMRSPLRAPAAVIQSAMPNSE